MSNKDRIDKIVQLAEEKSRKSVATRHASKTYVVEPTSIKAEECVLRDEDRHPRVQRVYDAATE